MFIFSLLIRRKFITTYFEKSVQIGRYNIIYKYYIAHYKLLTAQINNILKQIEIC